MQLATHSRQSLVRFGLRSTAFLNLRPTVPAYGQGFGKGVWVGPLAGLAEGTQEKKALGWEMVRLQGVGM